jgi:cytoskeleton protein RodZ
MHSFFLKRTQGLAGELFKKKREELGLDLREVADNLKISSQYLSAIEDDSFEKLPAPVYSVGYIRCYAKYLSIDPGPVITHFNSQVSSPEPPPTVIPISSSRKQVPIYLYVILLFTAGLLTFAVYVSRNGQQFYSGIAGKINSPVIKDQTLPETIVAEPGASESSSAGEIAVTEQETAPLMSGGDSSEKRTPLSSSHDEKQVNETVAEVEHRLGITASENAWLQIMFENGTIEEVLLRPGISKVWKFSGSALLKVGNAGGVTLRFDGEDLGVPGKPGQILKLNFPQI